MAVSKILIRAPASPERRAAARMTGRYLVTLHSDAQRHISTKLDKMGMKAATPLPKMAVSAKPLPPGSHLPLSKLGVTLVDLKPNQEDGLHQMAASESGVLAIEPERIVRATDVRDDYLRGWRDAVDALSGKLLDVPGELLIPQAEAFAEAVGLTWGLSATKVGGTQLSGPESRLRSSIPGWTRLILTLREEISSPRTLSVTTRHSMTGSGTARIALGLPRAHCIRRRDLVME